MIKAIPCPSPTPISHPNLVKSRPLALTMHGPHRCVGYYDFVEKVRYPCPQARHLAPQYQQCFRCQRREVTYYTFIGYAADPDAAQAYLEAHMHQTYLALFGRDLVKVGVAVVGRKYRRTLEQGAQACLFVAEANGAEIRELSGMSPTS